MSTNFQNFFDQEKMAAAGKSLFASQLKLAEEASRAAASEIEHLANFSGSLTGLKTGDDIANAAISYWSGVGLRSMAFAAKAKDNFEKTAKTFA